VNHTIVNARSNVSSSPFSPLTLPDDEWFFDQLGLGRGKTGDSHWIGSLLPKNEENDAVTDFGRTADDSRKKDAGPPDSFSESKVDGAVLRFALKMGILPGAMGAGCLALAAYLAGVVGANGSASTASVAVRALLGVAAVGAATFVVADYTKKAMALARRVIDRQAPLALPSRPTSRQDRSSAPPGI
jgi:hypothetical protein